MKVTNFGPNGLPIAVAGWSTGVTSLNSNVDITGGGPSALNFVQRITSNTSNTLLNPIVNFASGSNIAFSVNSNTLTIIGAAGGAGGAPTVISAGSNSTRVSELSGAGASSTLWSPYDHQHDGIGTITASSSNTLQRGTWNIRPGAGIALSLTDTDGDGEFDTTTIIATGVAAGGGGGGVLRYAAGLPSGALQRTYTFDSTVESWTTSAGTLSSTSSRLQLTHTTGAVGLEPSSAANVADGEVECEYRTTGNAGSAAIVFRATDASNYYMMVFQPAIGTQLYKCVAGGFTLLRNGTGLIADSVTGPFRILIRFNGIQLEGYVNGTLSAAVQEATYSTGRCGIRVDNATMQVDDYRIYKTPVATGNVRVEGL